MRAGGYLVLHYLYFYVMNDWRSTFSGVNDHESDWEQVFVYLSDEGDAVPIPRWVAYASHDFSGDDLRRRWDDPEVEKVGGTHPVSTRGPAPMPAIIRVANIRCRSSPRSSRRCTALPRRSTACGRPPCARAMS